VKNAGQKDETGCGGTEKMVFALVNYCPRGLHEGGAVGSEAGQYVVLVHAETCVKYLKSRRRSFRRVCVGSGSHTVTR